MTGLDIIGDVHGELPALVALGQLLGYDTARSWEHPDGRHLLFIGDLIDRGGHSLEVAQLVLALADSGRARCLLGNHEYNLVAHQRRLPG